MIWQKKEDGWRVPVKCWASNVEQGASDQAANMASMPCVFHHVAMMPDAHQGMGVCIGGVLALKNAICPNAIGVDIGCGMQAIKTNVKAEVFEDMSLRRQWQVKTKSYVPVGEGNHHKDEQKWSGFEKYQGLAGAADLSRWPLTIDRQNFGTLGGGNHFLENVWVHRKGATSAKKGETGIIPGSMGTSSYIVEGLGNPDSFMSCSHGAGRRMSRSAASQTLTVAECDEAMKGIVCDRWNKVRHGKAKGMFDLSEAPGAYKDIDEVIANEADLVKPVVKLTPLAVLKG